MFVYHSAVVFFSRYAIPNINLLSYKNNLPENCYSYEQAYRKIKKATY